MSDKSYLAERFSEAQQQSLLQLLKHFDHVPSPSGVLVKLCTILSEDAGNVPKMVEIIKQDAGLATQLINLSNTAYFSRGVMVSSLEEAVERVGFFEILKMVSLINRHAYRHQTLECYGVDAERAWMRSLCVAHMMEEIANVCDQPAGMFYLTGLVHDIGKYPIAHLVQRSGIGAHLDQDDDCLHVSEWELAFVGLDHADVAVAMLMDLGFPSLILDPIHAQKALNRGARGDDAHAHALFLSRQLAPIMMDPVGSKIEQVTGIEDSMKCLGLELADLRRMVPHALKAVYATSMLTGTHLRIA